VGQHHIMVADRQASHHHQLARLLISYHYHSAAS
jgi:hypothetical protein